MTILHEVFKSILHLQIWKTVFLKVLLDLSWYLKNKKVFWFLKKITILDIVNKINILKYPLYLSSISRNSVRAWIASRSLSGCTKFVGLTYFRRSWVGISESRTSPRICKKSSPPSSSELTRTQLCTALNISTSGAQNESLFEIKNKIDFLKSYFTHKARLYKVCQV